MTLTDSWQEVPEGAILPPGAEIRMDFATGKNWARLDPRAQQHDPGPEPEPEPVPVAAVRTPDPASQPLPYAIRSLLASRRIAGPSNGGGGSRDSAAFDLAWRMQAANLPMELRETLARQLWSLMDQPPGDPYPLETVLEKVYRMAGKGSNGVTGEAKRAFRARTDADYTATPVPFPPAALLAPSGDPERIRRLWEAGIPCIPLPLGGKAGDPAAGTKPPKFAHLETVAPSDDDWRKWQRKVWAYGNTGILFGHRPVRAVERVIEKADEPGKFERALVEEEDPRGAMTLYHIEVENADDFWTMNDADRNYILDSTPVVRSRKSIHIYIESGDRSPEGDTWHYTCHLRADGTKDYEFRGKGNYALAPGSLHPSSTPEVPVVYTIANPTTETILSIKNVPGWLRRYFPKLALGGNHDHRQDQVRTMTADELEALHERTLTPRQAAAAAKDTLFKMAGKGNRVRAAADDELTTIPTIVVNSSSMPKGSHLTVYSALVRGSLLPFLQDRWGREHDDPVLYAACGHKYNGRCPEHGQKRIRSIACRRTYCGYCLTDIGERLAFLTIVNITDLAVEPKTSPNKGKRAKKLDEEGAEIMEGPAKPFENYAHMVFEATFPLEEGPERMQMMKTLNAKAVKAVSDLNRTATASGRFISRGLANGLYHDRMLVQVRLMGVEYTGALLDAAVKYLGRLGFALRVYTPTTQGDQVKLQLMEDSRKGLLFADVNDREMLIDWFDAVKGTRMFQTYAWLQKHLREDASRLQAERKERQKQAKAPAGASGKGDLDMCPEPGCKHRLIWVRDDHDDFQLPPALLHAVPRHPPPRVKKGGGGAW